MIESNLLELRQWAADYIERLEPKARKILMMKLARQTRSTNQKRMQQQVNPDGSPWDARAPVDGKTSRRKMMVKLRQNKRLRIRARADEFSLRFTTASSRIARVHHFGQRDEKNFGAQYPERRLLGLTDQDRDDLRELLINHLTDNLS